MPCVFARDVRGSAAVEMALILVPLVMFLFGIIAIGQAMWLQNALDASVAAAARCASVAGVNPLAEDCRTPGEIRSYAADQAGAGFKESDFEASKPSCGNEVTASYKLTLLIPFVDLPVLTLSAKACFPFGPPKE
jgi:hypothetical protein